MDSGQQVGAGTFKAAQDFGQGDTIYGSLCCISVGCETVSGIIVWLLIPGKIQTVAALKATSRGCQKFRDLCAANLSSPLC